MLQVNVVWGKVLNSLKASNSESFPSPNLLNLPFSWKQFNIFGVNQSLKDNGYCPIIANDSNEALPEEFANVVNITGARIDRKSVRWNSAHVQA